MTTLKLILGTTPNSSRVVTDTGEPVAGVVAVQLQGNDLNFAPLVHLTLSGVEMVREAVQARGGTQESPFMGGQ